MKGFIYNGAKNIELKEIPLEPCGDKDIIVKNLYSGICGSDISAYKTSGDFMRLYPGMEFGHEMISEVVEVGKDVEGISVGDRVFPYPLYAKDDTKRSGSLGGFSEYVHIPNCRLDHSVYKVSDSISNPVAAMIEPFAVGGQAAILSQPKPGQNAIVYGAGVIGMAAAITLKYLGCDKVMLVNRSTYRLEIAKEMGFYTCSPVQQDLKETALDVFGTGYGIMGPTFNADIFVDATSANDAFTDFQKFGKLKAVFTIVGTHQKPMTFNPQMLMYASQRVQGSGGYTDQSVRLAMEIMASGKFDLEKLITQEYPFEQLEEAILKAAATRESLKVMIRYE
ncbi:MAG: zinc-binding dehydrogenase [Faecousia sp.]